MALIDASNATAKTGSIYPAPYDARVAGRSSIRLGEATIRAMRLAWERAKLMIEPSSAVALAAALTPSFGALPELKRVGIILSGGNVELDNLPWHGGHPPAEP